MPEGCGRATLHPGSIEEVARSLDPATIAARCTAHRIERPESPGDRRRIADIRPGDDGAAITVSDRAGIERCAAQHCDPDSAAASGQQAFALPAAADIDFTAARVTARVELGRLPRNDGVTEDNDPPAGLASGLFDRGINGDVENALTGFFRVHAGDKAIFAIRVFLAFFRVELAGFAGDTLGDDFGVFVDEDGHDLFLRFSSLRP